ncbi:hypothetical protein D3C81_1579420 [compost metagenome]
MVDPHPVDITHDALACQLGEDAVHVIIIAVKFLRDLTPGNFACVVLVNIVQQGMDFDKGLGIAAFVFMKCCDEMLPGYLDQPFGELQGG